MSLRVAIAVALACAGCGGSSGGAPPAEFAGPPQRVTVTGYADHLMEPFVSRDGARLFFNNRNDPPDATDLHVASRIDDLTFQYAGPLASANSARLDAVPSLDTSGRFVFVSLRTYDTSLVSVFRGDLAGPTVTAINPVAGIARGVPGFVNFDAEVSANGDRLYYVDGHFAGSPVPDAADILVADRAGNDFLPAANAAALFASVNTSDLEYAPALSADELELFFTRIAGSGTPKLFRARRGSVTAAFGAPEEISAATGFVEAATITPDARAIYYHALEGGTFVLMRLAR